MTDPGIPVPPAAAPVPPPAAPAPPAAWHAAPGNARPRLISTNLLVRFAIVFGLVIVAAAIASILLQDPPPPPGCPQGPPCSRPIPGGGTGSQPSAPPSAPPGTVGIRAGTPWTSTELRFEFEYGSTWVLDAAHPTWVSFKPASGNDAVLFVEGVASGTATPEALADTWLSRLKDSFPDLAVDSRKKNTIVGPEIGFVDGLANSYAGSATSPQGATPVGVSLVVSSDGRTTVAVVLVVWNPDTAVGKKWSQYDYREVTELILKTFRWGPVP